MFKDGAADVEKWAATTSAALGRSNKQMLESANAMGQMLAPMIGNRAAAQDMSQNLARLSVDMASFFANTKDADALQALKSGLSGETEPLKRFGVVMNDAALSAFAMSQGLKVQFKDMDQASQTTVRYAFIMKSLSDAQSDAIRTADSFPNQMKRMEGSLANVAARIGEALLPAATELVTALNGVLDWFNQLDDATVKQIATLGAVAAGVLAAVAGFTGVAMVLPSIIEGFAALATVAGVVTAPLLLIVAAIVGIVAHVVLLREAWRTNLFGIRDYVANVRRGFVEFFGYIISATQKAGAFFAEAWDSYLEYSRNAFLFFAETVLDTLKALMKGASVLPGLDLSNAIASVEQFKQALGSGGSNGVGGALKDMASKAMDALSAGGKAAGDFIASAAKNAKADLLSLLPAFGAGKSAGASAGGYSPVDLKHATINASAAAIQQGQEKAAKASAALASAQVEEMERLQKQVDAMKPTLASRNLAGPAGLTSVRNAAVMSADAQSSKAATERAAIVASQQAAAAFGEGVVASFKSSMGQFGGMITDAADRMMKGGAAFESIAQVALMLIQSSEGLRAVFDAINVVLKALADVLGAMFEPIAPIIEIVGSLAAQFLRFIVTFNPLSILIQVMATLFDAVAPILALFALEMQALSPLLTVIVTALVTMNPLFLAFSASMRFLFEVTRGGVLTVLEIALAFSNLWNNAVSTIQSIFNRVISAFASYLPDSAVKAMRDAVNGIASGVMVNTQGLQQSIDTVRSVTYDSAVQVAKGMNKAAAAAEKVAEALTNVPTGFKIAAARYAAQDSRGALGAFIDNQSGLKFGGGIPHFASGGRVTGPTLALVGEGGEPENIIPDSKMGALGGITINVLGSGDPSEVAQRVIVELEKRGLAKNGTPFPAGPRFAVGR